MSLKDAEDYVTKYMAMIGSKKWTPRPTIVVRNSITNWLGRDTFTPSRPETTLMEIQKSILDDKKTLERIIAHETVHHENAMNFTEGQLALIKLGVRPSGHGRDFLAKAALINAVMGSDFVTVKSDQTYVVKGTKPYTILIEPALKRLGWSWAVKLSDEAKAIIEKKKIENNAKVITTTDPRWASGARIKRFAGVAIPAAGSAEEKLLREMYDAA